MKENNLYSDKLVAIKENEIVLHNYFFPIPSDKIIKYSDIEKIEIVKPTLKTGKYRYWGTGDFLHWFPMDFHRNNREVIFILHRKNKKIRIGFTVENADKVKELLSNKVVMQLV